MRNVMGTALAIGLMSLAGSSAWATDTVRLGGPSAQADVQGGTNSELVRGYHGGGYHGGYHGGYGGRYYGGYGRSYYGGYYGRSYYGGGYGYRYPYYSSFYYRPYYYSPYYSSGYYYSTPYYYGAYYSPCNGDIAPNVTLQAQAVYPAQSAPRTNVPPMPPASDSNGTYPYNGGPSNPVPMPAPGQAPVPQNGPQGVIPIDGKLVSLPQRTTGGTSPVTTPEIQRLRYATTTNAAVPAAPIRVTYPAYGEGVTFPAPRSR